MSTAMPVVNLNLVIDQVAKDKGVERHVLVQTLEQAIHQAALKAFGQTRNIEAQFNEDRGVIELFQTLTVVEELSEDPDERVNQILLSVATDSTEGGAVALNDEMLFQIFYRDEDSERAFEQDQKCGDILGLKTYRRGFGRIAAQTAKQVIIQRVRDAERENVHGEYKDRKGEIVTGIVRRAERGNLIVDLGRAEAILPAREQIPRETYRPGDRIQAYVVDVLREAKGPQIVLSRTANEFLMKLFEMEVPEIADHTVVIEAAAREPGSRAKIAVSTQESDVDPVGACVGMKGSRVQAIVQELRGEKIDIVPYDEEVARFVCNALAPAEVARVLVDDNAHSMEIVVPDDQLSLAIGRRGQNVRLASQLTGWKLEIHSETKVKEMREFAEKSLSSLGLSEQSIDVLYNNGYRMAKDLVDANPAVMLQVPGITVENWPNIYTKAKSQMVTDSADLFRMEREKEAARIASERRHPDQLSQQERWLRVRGVTEKTIESLKASGYHSVDDVGREVNLEKLSTVDAVGPKKAKQLKSSVDQYLMEETRLRADLDAERARNGQGILG